MGVEETQCNFRPSTSPLTQSSPSQTSIQCAERYCITCNLIISYSIVVSLSFQRLNLIKLLLVFEYLKIKC